MYKTFVPKSKLLKKHVREFTVLENTDDFPVEYFVFPHNIGSLVFLNKANFKFQKNTLEIKKEINNKASAFTIGKYTEPIVIHYSTFIDEIAINFTPTGINYFFEENYNDISALSFQSNADPEIVEFSGSLFKLPPENRIERIERFLLQRLRDKNLETIENAIEILETDLSIKFKDLSKRLYVSERNLNRQFHKFIGCSPKDFKKILRFRKVLMEFQNSDSNLTQICLKNDYYDSPHFIREFKKLTNKKPLDYFKQISYISNKNYPYIFK